MTNETAELRKTRKEMLKSAIPRRYVVACSGVVVRLKGKKRQRMRERAMVLRFPALVGVGGDAGEIGGV